MKKMRRLIPAIAMLLVSAVMLSTASFAWFTMGSHATATGMSVTATASSTLLISKTNGYEGFKNATGEVAWDNASPKALIPATHDNGQLGENETSASGLVTIGNSTIVVPGTGAYTGEYVEVEIADNGDYYIDYTVFIGASGAAMTNKKLNMIFTLEEDLAYTLHNAVSIDLIVDKSTADNNPGEGETEAEVETFKQTITLKAIDNSKASIGGTETANALMVEIFDGTIPSALVPTDDSGDAFNDSIKVTMRVYFDGAMVETAATYEEDGKTVKTPAIYYVRNAVATLESIGFDVRFEAVDKPNAQ